MPANTCSALPRNSGRLRPWRSPSHTSAAPSIAQVHAVERADSASGTAIVAKPSASNACD